MARDVRMSMSAHVTTMRRQERHQDEQQKNYRKNPKKTQQPVTCPYVTKTDSNAVINQPES